MDSQHVKLSERLFESAWQYSVLFSDYSERKPDSKNAVLVLSEILRLFLNILTPDQNCCLSVKTSV